MTAKPLATAPRGAVVPSIDTRLLDHLPVAVLLCDPLGLVVSYANAAAVARLRHLDPLLPVTSASLTGTSLELFDKKIRQALRGFDTNAAGRALAFEIAGESFEVHASPVRDARQRLAFVQLTFAGHSRAEADADVRTQRLLQMVDDMPINVMTCDPHTFTIDYANKASIETLRRIESHLPIRADQLVGSSIDVFHKHPAHQRAMLADPKNLPHFARIRVGPETLDLRVSAMRTADGGYAGPMLTWSLMTESVAIAASVTEVVEAMTLTSQTVQSSSESLLTLTERSEQMASGVSAAAVEMSASFDEIFSRIRDASAMSRDTAERAGVTDRLVGGLSESVEKIGTVTALIEKIASQTNLLALNATIEAARVGEMGKGFAVVAQEVKALALQTAKATQDIRLQIEAVQGASGAAAKAVSDITQNVATMSEVFVALSAGMEEQSATSRSVSASITGVSQASGQIRDAALGVRGIATEVSGFAERLRGETANLVSRRS
ncbi:methyl-accepting chemotaxis protein [Aquabacter spiritensis]|uniref:Methyl-accepting chemotaxis sensory transducer with Pas/Pac sensor n=1 Tax=Aquabacter spiritensis TaxID=933073 RepID=A0A4R3LZS3_9HYPH|nr:methyl-accepting chemotaxis protein [Aquabacter spiritensis]TCT04287.1 methyl-accepting chemotaxis sensory transducer with Pas/Pac sensor [Aquabacter spiritensis]